MKRLPRKLQRRIRANALKDRIKNMGKAKPVLKHNTTHEYLGRARALGER
jgi:hypothetical protein